MSLSLSSRHVLRSVYLDSYDLTEVFIEFKSKQIALVYWNRFKEHSPEDLEHCLFFPNLSSFRPDRVRVHQQCP